MRKGLTWAMIICIILIAIIIISIFTYLGKEANNQLNTDWGLDTTVSTMTPEEQAEYYNHDAYNNHITESQAAWKKFGTTIAIIAIAAIVIVIVIAKKKSRG